MKSFFAVMVASAVLVGCGGAAMKSGGKTAPPSAAAVTSAANKTPPATKPATTTNQMVENACTAADVGKCGCLPTEAWFTDGTNIFDVVCCEAIGNTISLYACGATANCDSSGEAIVCK